VLLIVKRRWVCGWASIAFAIGLPSLAHAAPPACPPNPIRWMDDCSSLAGKTLTGVDRLRYIPVGDGWLTLGGEAKVRAEGLNKVDFGIGGASEYHMLGSRFLLDGDLHITKKFRVFAQVVAADEQGRKPIARAQDRDRLDLSQIFIDAPLDFGVVSVIARYGRHELELSGNRLVTTREGVGVRRAFNGPLVNVYAAGGRLTLFRLHPTKLLRGSFDDTSDRADTFAGASLDFPRTQAGLFTAFLFDRSRADGRALDFEGAERRYSAGFRYAGRTGGWDGSAQLAAQWGRAADGRPIHATGDAVTGTYAWDAPHLPRLLGTIAYASGDRRRGDGAINTFDPVYPNNFGLSDAPYLYQTNFLMTSAQGLARFGGADFGLGALRVSRASAGDALYGQGRALPGTVGHGLHTAWLLQANVRTPITPRVDFYASYVRALVGDHVKAAGGDSGGSYRIDLAARF
jgi:hypothetical protein